MSLNVQECKFKASQKIFILLKIFKWSAISLIVAILAGTASTVSSVSMELFGSHVGIYAGIACVVSYLFSGHSGIYQSQQVKTTKYMDFSEL